MIAGGYARVLTYFTCLSRRLYSRSRDRNLSPRNMRSIIQQALIYSDHLSGMLRTRDLDSELLTSHYNSDVSGFDRSFFEQAIALAPQND
ncbi:MULTISPECIES: hypothetical protein [unclassified Microcoleus]